VPTGGPPVDTTPIANIATHARITASNVPVPVQYWLRAVNDGKVRPSPLPPDMWATWSSKNPPRQWIEYQWDEPQTIDGSSLHFWGDHGAGSGVGVAPPKTWTLEYWDGVTWRAVNATSPYTSALNADNRVEFTPVTTHCLRAVFDASTDGATYAAVALQEWEVYSTRLLAPLRPSVKGVASANCSSR